MPLERLFAEVLLEPKTGIGTEEPTVHRVEIRTVDQLDVEERGGAKGNFRLTLRWAHAALHREGLVDASENFATFTKRCIAFTVDKQPANPTQPAASDDSASPSPSQPDSPSTGG